jgi:mono/diheme cytochrome c family protein
MFITATPAQAILPVGRMVTALLLVLAISLTGCGLSERPVVFEPNLVQAMKYQIKNEIPMEQASKDATWLVTKMFGTPDEPTLPEAITGDEEVSGVLSMERLEKASGPHGEGRGLYRKHCALCHGITGNGRGTQAGILYPYPRDYRMGIFKFKSTTQGAKPTREDLAKLIKNGITGTAMKKIDELTDDDVEALVDYVIYLSMRGELERSLLDIAPELDIEGGERIIDTEFSVVYETDKALIEKLREINEETDADELIDYETYLNFGKRLESDAGLAEKLKDTSDEGEAALIKYLAEKYPGTELMLAELNQQLDEPFELEEETVDDLAAELADELADKYDDYVDLGEELAEDTELKDRLETVSTQTTGKQLEQYELFVQAWDDAEDMVVDLAEEWLEAPENVLEVPEPPSVIPVAENYEQFVALSQGDQAEALADSVKRGQELFVGKIANCSKCHGATGLGDGQTKDYDEWTKDWTTKVGLKPEDRESLIPLLARGALPPVNAKPRNFAEGLFHGGSGSADLYRRIKVGIEGSPMPGATFVEGQFEQDDVWHIINFIRSLQKPEPDEPEVTAQASL